MAKRGCEEKVYDLCQIRGQHKEGEKDTTAANGLERLRRKMQLQDTCSFFESTTELLTRCSDLLG